MIPGCPGDEMQGDSGGGGVGMVPGGVVELSEDGPAVLLPEDEAPGGVVLAETQSPGLLRSTRYTFTLHVLDTWVFSLFTSRLRGIT